MKVCLRTKGGFVQVLLPLSKIECSSRLSSGKSSVHLSSLKLLIKLRAGEVLVQVTGENLGWVVRSQCLRTKPGSASVRSRGVSAFVRRQGFAQNSSARTRGCFVFSKGTRGGGLLSHDECISRVKQSQTPPSLNCITHQFDNR
ncbi:hypothetical protein HanRHA438_Chr04g0174511 [Helianthus annuus]|nr:hypothetical protein HanRHA438_Chr04g0174511 [Helianthus annuus]